MIRPSPSLIIAAACARLGGRAFPKPRDGHCLAANGACLRVEEEELASVRFVNLSGYWAHFDPCSGSSGWPIPYLETVNEIADFARHRGVLEERAELGDLALAWSPVFRRFTRISIVAAPGDVNVHDGVDEIRCLTLGVHCRDARASAERFMPVMGDRFVRWHVLVHPDSAGRAA